MSSERKKRRAEQTEETSVAIERLIDCVGRALDVYEEAPTSAAIQPALDRLNRLDEAMQELRDLFDDVMEKLRRSL